MTVMSRFSDILGKHGDKFLHKALHPREIVAFKALKDDEQRVRFVASRWAAKEAVVKAAGKRLLFPEILLASGSEGASRVPLACLFGLWS